MSEPHPDPEDLTTAANERQACEDGGAWTRLYADLRKLAAAMFAHERVGHTLQPTALVHEAYIRLIDQDRVTRQGRNHFLANAARMIRRVLVDHARAKQAEKRGGSLKRHTLAGRESSLGVSGEIDTVELDDLMNELERLAPRQARIVELRYFGGLRVDECADVLELSATTVKNESRAARAWIGSRLEHDE